MTRRNIIVVTFAIALLVYAAFVPSCYEESAKKGIERLEGAKNK